MLDRVYAWLDRRIGLEVLKALGAAKRVPLHRFSMFYALGGLLLVLFAVQCITGALLFVYYAPGLGAHESVRTIMQEIPAGAWIRSVHAWAANLMIAVLIAHMFSAFFMKAYRAPRELTWLSGLALCAIGLGFGFTGYLLPMDDLAFFATNVALGFVTKIPILGQAIGDIVFGGLEVGELTVKRFFCLHTIALPTMLVATATFHVWMVQRHGLAETFGRIEEANSVAFWPTFVSREAVVWILALAAIAAAAALLPRGLGEAADPLKPTPSNIHPEWYFMGVFQGLRAVGRVIPGVAGEVAALALGGGIAVLWVLVPFYDSEAQQPRSSRFVSIAGALIAMAWVLLTLTGYVAL